MQPVEGESLKFNVTVQTGDILSCETSGGSGDVDLFLLLEDETEVCEDASDSNDQQCTAEAEADGVLVVRLLAYMPFSGVQLD